jgi:hypothetical protein
MKFKFGGKAYDSTRHTARGEVSAITERYVYVIDDVGSRHQIKRHNARIGSPESAVAGAFSQQSDVDMTYKDAACIEWGNEVLRRVDHGWCRIEYVEAEPACVTVGTAVVVSWKKGTPDYVMVLQSIARMIEGKDCGRAYVDTFSELVRRFFNPKELQRGRKD